MVNQHDLARVLDWANRPEWVEKFEELFDEHTGLPCEEHDISLEQLPELIGEAQFMNLWGCVFEDLLSRDFEGRNLADEYLKRRGWKESPGNRAYIKALRSSRMSLYEISAIRRDEGFYARDLLRGGEPVWVSEKRATHGLVEWDRVGARIVKVNSRVQLAGGVLRFTRETADEVIASFRAMQHLSDADATEMVSDLLTAVEVGDDLIAGMDGADLEQLRQLVSTLAETADDRPLGIDGALALGASEFTSTWLDDILDKLTNRGLPTLVNSDGDPFVWIEIEYPLAKSVRQADVAAALSAVPDLRPANAKSWDWWTPPRSKARKHTKEKKETVPTTTSDRSSTVLGTLELRGRFLTLSVNSHKRAGRGRSLLEEALTGLVGEPKIEERSLEEITIADQAGDGAAYETGPAQDLLIEPEEMTRFLREHYMAVLDEPLPVLGGKSPRNAVKTKAGRQKTIEWLKQLENHHGHMAHRGSGIDFDCTWMWEELGLSAD